MRDTYADTSLARADLGFDADRPRSTRGTCGRVRLAEAAARCAFPCNDTMMIASDPSAPSSASPRASRRSPALSAGACGASRNKIPTGTTEPDKFLFERATRRSTTRSGSSAREFYPDADRHLPAEPASRRRQARTRRQLPRRRLARRRRCWRSTSTASSCRSTRRTRAPTTPSSRRRCRTTTRWRRPGRDQTETREAIAEFEILFDSYPNSPLRQRGAKEHYREARDRLGQSDYGIGMTYYRLKWYPGVVRGCRSCSRAIRSSPIATPSTSTSPSRWSS